MAGIFGGMGDAGYGALPQVAEVLRQAQQQATLPEHILTQPLLK